MSGLRRRFSLLGHPVRHSISPSMCGAAFLAMKEPCIYSAIDVPSDKNLPRFVDDLRTGRISGCNVTLPYKRLVMSFADEVDASAEAVGAANVLAVSAKGRVVAHNTDAEALAAELDALTAGRPKLRAAVVGAGGAGLAAIVALQKIGYRIIAVTSRSWSSSEVMHESETAAKARALGALPTCWPGDGAAEPSGKLSQVMRLQWGELVTGADCVVQATSAGMKGGDPGDGVAAIVPWSALPAHAVAYDVIYVPRETPFLAAAKARGLTASGGLGMLVRQAALSIRLWTGKDPPLDVMRKAAEDALEATNPR